MAADRWRSQCVPETNVVKIADELARGMRKGERVAPEEPLERGYTDGHHGEPDQGKGRFPSGESRVEETAEGVSHEAQDVDHHSFEARTPHPES